jgi:hypothetical protein
MRVLDCVRDERWSLGDVVRVSLHVTVSQLCSLAIQQV